MGTRGVGRICSRLTILLTVRVPGVFEKTGSKNSKQRDSVCPNRLRRETSDAIALVIFVIFMEYICIIIYAYY